MKTSVVEIKVVSAECPNCGKDLYKTFDNKLRCSGCGKEYWLKEDKPLISYNKPAVWVYRGGSYPDNVKYM